MNIFKKCYKLDHSLLAKAISIYSKNIVFEGQSKYFDEIISLNDVLKIKISYLDYVNSIYCHYYSMGITTYIENIEMAQYRFTYDWLYNPYSTWECSDKKIRHHMPNQFIDLMNKWSKQIVSEHEKKLADAKRKKEEAIKEHYNKEESILNKYR